MGIVFNFVLPILVVVFILAVIYFLYRALRSRSKAGRRPYNVGRQEERQTSQVNIIRAFFALILAFILLGVIGIGPRLIDQAPVQQPDPMPTELLDTPAPTVVPTSTVSILTPESSPTPPVPTSTATPLPTASATPEPLTAVVISENGVWLRDAPGIDSEQIEWLLLETVLFVLDGRESADDIEWQQVETAGGVTGWVAAEYISINNP